MKDIKNTVSKLTTIDALKDLQTQFKIKSISDGFSQQKLFNRAMHLYMTDEEFRNKITNHFHLRISGSNY